MSTTNDTLSLADLERLLPPEYIVLAPGDPRNDRPHTLRAVQHEASGQIHFFSSAQEYLQFIVTITPRRVLSSSASTRYLLLSASYDADPWFHASVTHTVAALTCSSVVLHRMKSDETSVRFVLSEEEMATLIEGYQSYLRDGEQEAASSGEFDPFLADVAAEQESRGAS